MTTQPQPEALPPLPKPDANRAEWDGGWRQYHDPHDPLPEQWDDKPDCIVPLFTADQMRAYATEHAARLHAECEALRQANGAFAARQAWWNDRMVALEAECEALRMERDALRAAARHGGWVGYIDSDAMQADAERYRWLCLAAGDWGVCEWDTSASEWVRDSRGQKVISAAIDAARAAKEQSK